MKGRAPTCNVNWPLLYDSGLYATPEKRAETVGAALTRP
jgi:hypothetical protein